MVCAFVLLIVQAGAADASYLLLQMGSLFGGSATVWDPSLNGGLGGWLGAGVGKMSGTIDRRAVDDVMCVDTAHSFSWGQHWQVDQIVVPPDPSSPPPFATLDCAYVYHNYKTQWMTNADWSFGVQMAIWEITQETDWRSAYALDNHWWQYGTFKVNGDPGTIAKGIISSLALFTPTSSQAGHLYYYKPLDATPGQGLIDDVPEPSSVIMLGVALLGGVGLAWRRRS